METSETKDNQDDNNPDSEQCDWIICAPRCVQSCNKPNFLLLWLCLCSFTQSMVVNGFVSAVLTTLEKRFELSSVDSGMIASMYDLGVVICLLPVTYIGDRYRRSRIIGTGIFIMSMGSFTIAMPHFLTQEYSYKTQQESLCRTNQSITFTASCQPETLSNYKWFFYMGQLLHGFGASPIYTLAVAYLDDNLSKSQSGLYLGVYYTMGLFGPALGFLLGGVFLNQYVDITRFIPTDLTPDNTSQWIGAWWAGFLLCGTLCLVAAGPVFGYPKSFPGSENKEANKKIESHGNSHWKSKQTSMHVKDLIANLKIIIVNPTFIFVSLGGSAEIVIGAAMATFGPKYIQIMFKMKASTATMIIGLVSVPCAAMGIFLGGLLLKFRPLSMKQLLRFVVVVSLISVLLTTSFFIRCPSTIHFGMDHRQCNSDCGCGSLQLHMHQPVCGDNHIEYFSPCHAGCSASPVTTSHNSSNTQSNTATTDKYLNCSCVWNNQVKYGAAATKGVCSTFNCYRAPIFLTLIGLFQLVTFSITIPALHCTMRSVPTKLKSLALGVQSIMMRVLGSIPGPMLVGKIIDSTCKVWSSVSCHNGFCSVYNVDRFWAYLFAFVFSLKSLQVILFMAASLLYKPPEVPTNIDISTIDKINDTSNAATYESKCMKSVDKECTM